MATIKGELNLPDGNGGYDKHHLETEVDQVVGLKEKFRQPSTAYTVGKIAYHASLPTGYYLECTTAGTTSNGDLSIGGGISVYDTITDGTVTWTVLNVFVALKDKAGNDLESIVAQSLGQNGYVKYSSGLIVQWGMINIQGQTTTNLPLPISFTTNYTIVATCRSDNTLRTVVAYSHNMSLAKLYASAGTDVFWIAIGY